MSEWPSVQTPGLLTRSALVMPDVIVGLTPWSLAGGSQGYSSQSLTLKMHNLYDNEPNQHCRGRGGGGGGGG